MLPVKMELCSELSLVAVLKAMEENKFYKLIRDIKSCGVCEDALPSVACFSFFPRFRDLSYRAVPKYKGTHIWYPMG